MNKILITKLGINPTIFFFLSVWRDDLKLDLVFMQILVGSENFWVYIISRNMVWAQKDLGVSFK